MTKANREASLGLSRKSRVQWGWFNFGPFPALQHFPSFNTNTPSSLFMARCPPSPIKNRKTHWSPHPRALIRNSRLYGDSFRNVGKKFNISPTSAKSLFHRWKDRETTDSLPRPGRPPILTAYDKRHILRAIKADPFISNKELLCQCGLCCGIQTLIR